MNIERVLIGSVELGKTKGGKVVAKLFSTDKRLEYPAIVLFDLSMLEQVGLDPNELGTEPVYRRFWAYYTESEKTTSRGNPYRDCQYLELIGQPATAASTDTGALLEELRAIRALLARLVNAVDGTAPPVPEPGPAEPPPEEEEVSPETEASPLDEAFPWPTPQPEPAPIATDPGGGVPMTSGEMVRYLTRTHPEIKCSGIGHLLWVMKKVYSQGWGWPNSQDQDGWREVADGWAAYWEQA